ncbi:MAG TPA: N-acetylneuraminate synthase family protein [bacterium]|nr:N-acetylneuraminate synthase family protein [bacterium]HPN30907.1 N-acetylneuraminate synthase family protein [bacterium]
MKHIDFKNLDKPYLIGEIGINHNGDMQIAKKLIDATFACGWDCVKFQKRTPDLCVPEAQKNILRDTPWGKISYIDYRKKIEFEKKEFNYIDSYCREKPINWSASVWDIPSLEFILDYEVPFLKIPSAHLTNNELIIESAKSGLTILLSTGMSSIEEIDGAVETLKKYAKNYVLMHTNSSYPTPIDELNLRVIETLKKRYECPIGYSGHEYGLEPTLFAVAFGAVVIERHITIDHEMWGTDQSASVEVMGMDMLAKRLRNANKIWGTAEKIITQSEMPIRQKLRGN